MDQFIKLFDQFIKKEKIKNNMKPYVLIYKIICKKNYHVTSYS